MTDVEWWRAFDQCTADKIVEKMKGKMLLLWILEKKYVKRNILLGLLVLF